MIPISIIVIFATFASISDASFSGEGLQSAGPSQWFSGEQLYFVNDKEQPSYEVNRRYKRSYGGSYQTKGYGSGSYGKLNEGYQNGAQLGMQCYALARTATNQWCYDNCLQGFCPKHVCSCTGEVYNRALKPTYDTYSKSSQYVKPSYGHQSTGYQTGYVKPSYGHQSTGYQSTYGQSSFSQPKYGGSYGGQKTYGGSDYSKTSSFGGYQKSGYQTAQQIEPRQFEQQKTQF